MKGGEVFVPKIPSMRLVDMAKAIAPDAQQTIIGIRPGEKLHEELITREEWSRTKEFDGFYVIEPEHTFWNRAHVDGGRTVAEGFEYRSDTNSRWLTAEETASRLLRRVALVAHRSTEGLWSPEGRKALIGTPRRRAS
jgi:UDP-N-acetylglucosamine 4,6-dehydratase